MSRVSSDSHIVPVDINTCLDAIIQAFHDGGAIIQKIKKKRAVKRAPPPPRLLEESIDQAPDGILQEKKRGIARFGQAFEHGDYITIIALQQITIQLQSALLEKLRNAAFDDDHAITDFTYLVDAVDIGRDRTIATLHEFKQRLLNGSSSQDALTPIAGPLTPVMSSSHASNHSLVTPSVSSSPRSSLTRLRTNSSTGPVKPNQGLQRTWTRDYNHASDEGDASAGADDTQQSHTRRKRSSIMSIFSHKRNVSGNDDKNSIPTVSTPAAILEEPDRSKSVTSPTSMASNTHHAHSHENHPPGKATTEVTDSGATFTYEEWEDNPQEIWGPKVQPPVIARRETTASSIAPEVLSPSSMHPPTSPILVHRTNSITPNSTSLIPTPSPDNDYLGYCKGAWKLQNGDRKALAKGREVEPWSRHPSSAAASMQYLSCVTKGCAFRSNIAHADTDVIWNKVFTFAARGLKLRWPFLAKSHVQQKVVVKAQYSFKCLFCVFMGGKSGVYHGMEYYLDHIVDEHRGRALGDVVLYKTSCINDRVAENEEAFDINLFPLDGGDGGGVLGGRDRAKSGDKWMSVADGPFDPNDVGGNGGWRSDGAHDSMFGSNEPWNEGLSDFKYRGELDRTSELE
ncbi:unnamed protein product [Zymoseptoria tritici ST99CH_1A5]|uniref:Uncharacterized protein n=3 Tax=Zymoseptoria tritici TaxID=1047171 RepID=A0A1X7S5X4_ZYMT9|nr:unnamed protein product [Zymoseptoria tritici ST99CH_3D7]SMR60292.1 unnamed protein product [Zymoseptoria tritici ST99CH_1E4]SMR63403.1 unnamed protein product [Zymoseptoria tritici ST99CH_3D1]SMY28747.1 unnamed protein product [Zymoseptoria tritici ST99CH_1A5]